MALLFFLYHNQKSRTYILLIFSYCVPQKKESLKGLEQNENEGFHFLINYSIKQEIFHFLIPKSTGNSEETVYSLYSLTVKLQCYCFCSF